jgi:hypothetical protein
LPSAQSLVRVVVPKHGLFLASTTVVTTTAPSRARAATVFFMLLVILFYLMVMRTLLFGKALYQRVVKMLRMKFIFTVGD